MTKDQAAAQSKRRRAFVRGVKAGHAKRKAVTDDNLRSRNAYRLAIGLPIIAANITAI